MPDNSFVHLHLHTQYSLLDGAIMIDKLCTRAKDLKMPAVAMTDHGNMFGGIEFYLEALKKGLKPILGCELYIQSTGSRFDKNMRRGHEPYHHLIALASDLEGYKNLCQLITIGYLEGFYYKPRIDKEVLQKYSKGLIILSGCLSGEVADAAMNNGLPGAKSVVEEYVKIFGDRFYLEAQGNSIPEQKRVNDILFQLSHELSVPLVATNDCHYLHREDAEAHEALLCIQTGKTLQDENRMKFHSDEFYVRTPDEMYALFKDFPEAVSNTLQVADRCNLELDLKTYYFPKYEAPVGKSLDDCLDEDAWRGLEARWQLIWTTQKEGTNLEELKEKYNERLRGELEMIKKMGFAGYFLIVADFINYAKNNQIPVGPGRGSAAGSLVAYCLNITDIDPIPYNLLFERFLNPERISMPDMDIDFCMNRRPEVIAYVQKKYGNVGQIITFGKMRAKAVIRDVGRVMNMPYGEVDKIAKLIPNTLNITLNDACKIEPKLNEMAGSDARVAKLLSMARSLEGLNRHASTHAAGVVISDQPLVNFMPLYKGQNDEIVSQYDMKYVEKVGLIKFDFLGLKTLTIIDDALKIIKRTRDKDIKINELLTDDPAVYASLSTGDTMGIFQLESAGMRELIIKMKPTVFPDLIALVALYRPGPLGSGMVDEFINRKHGRIPVKYDLQKLEKILEETYGIIVYQEQVMQIASTLANFSLGDADLLRRAMGKKKLDEMTQQRAKFMQGCETNQVNKAKAEKVFDLMEKFAEYGFNKSHSAAYAFVSYQTAFLKAHYTVEFMASLLTHEMGNTEKVMAYIQDAREHGIEILPPDINESFVGFSVSSEKQIRFGLAAVKNVGEAAIETIIQTRQRVGGFKSFQHFCNEVDLRKVNKRVFESLIKCGAFDSLKVLRTRAMVGLEMCMERASGLQKEKASGQANLFMTINEEPNDDHLPQVSDWLSQERLNYEREALGFYITGHPLTEHVELLKKFASGDTFSLREMEDGKDVSFGGVVNALRETLTKKGEKMGFATIEDLKGIVSVIVFSDLYKSTQTLLQGNEPLFIRGTADVGEDGVKIIAREIVPLSRLMQQGGVSVFHEVHFHLQERQVSKEQLEALKKLLQNHRGHATAYLRLPDTTLALPASLKVNPTSQLKKEADQLFGASVTILQ